MDRFDLVVIGAGSAGATLAGRLSEDPARRVLLLEAGPDHTAADAPEGVQAANFMKSFEESGRLWDRLVARRADGQDESLYVRGRGAGGSSSVNGMVAIRGTVDDYDRWSDQFGCTGWGWKDMLEAFLSVEDDVDYGGDGWHGRGGPIPLGRLGLEDQAPLDRALRTAMTEIGYPVCDDYHSPDATGLSRWALTMRHGKRFSTNDAYLEPARARPNLTVRGGVHVDRVVLDGRRAVAVRTASGEEIEAAEIIVSAGTIHSPAILLRSGIGVDDGLAVGANLKDHATASFGLILNHAGRKTSNDGPVGHSVLRYDSQMAGAGPNDMQMTWFNSMGTGADGLAQAGLLGSVMRVFSHGNMRLRSGDPFDDPILEFRMLSDDRDLTRLRDGVRRMIDVVTHPTVTAITEHISALGGSLDELSDDDAIDRALRATVTEYAHPVGTCRMGRADDSDAVVDSECKVIGYEQLRVCDASVMPDLPKCNTHLTTVAIAELLIGQMHR